MSSYLSHGSNRHVERKKTTGKNYISEAISGLIIVLIVEKFWPEVIPFTMGEFWVTSGRFVDWFLTSWPFFAWAFGFTFLLLAAKGKDAMINMPMSAKQMRNFGFIISSWAGFMEEITHRWLIFLGGIVTVKIANFFFFGFLGFGIPEWFHMHLFGPIANFVTLGHLEDFIFHPVSWAVGASMLSANALFRDGHSYQGIFGWLNSWIFGFMMFYLLFQYGLWACIIIHFAYDLLIFWMLAVYLKIKENSSFQRRKFPFS